MKILHTKHIGITLVIFIILMLLVKLDFILMIDEPIYNFVRLLHQVPFMDRFLIVYSNLFQPWHLVGFMAVILIILFFKNKKLSLITMTWAIVTLLLGIGLKYFIHRARPVEYISGFSFPSLHTLTIVVAAVVFLTLMRKRYWHYIAYLMIFIMMVSRIYVHAHYFSDTVGAVLFGYLMLHVAQHFIAKYQLDVPFTSRLESPWQRDT
ncbi:MULTISPECIES: phosphatase PAP2 family protein [unclassified Staphylococcus]|nr:MULTISPECIES: phosphatase PAP2 family protein [unclassified Staphylococcus]KXA43255.1 PAP2 family protein [Staphylococcus simulans]OFM15899.1 phosphatase [Staphylococcus sp. HMSC059E03]OFN20033.1 phosphatase [Staphylococcus sp. HMSC055C03]OHR54478.1 phosphatase [Staphylococcus sp. HMSC070A03]OFV04231.1 phosphatase [Staphylococcus sp. HMSC12H08]